MKLFKKLLSALLVTALVMGLTACSNFETKAKNNVDAYMKKMKSLTTDTYISWVEENLGNPYQDAGLAFDQLREGQITYFVDCLSKVEYEIVNIDEEAKYAEVNVTYVDSTEYFTKLFTELLNFAFSENYSEEGENQIYLDVMNSIEEYQFMNDTIYFGLNDDASISMASDNTFDVATAGLYKVMLGDSSEIESQEAKYTAEELLNNIEVKYEVLDENAIFVTFTNNNDVAVSPTANFCFLDSDGNEIIRSISYIEALPAGATNYSYAYNELSSEGVVDFNVELEISYYNPEDIIFYDESLIPYEIKQEEDMVSICFTNNTEDTVNICGGYIVYNQAGDIMTINDVSIYDLAPGAQDSTWFYLSSEYDESTDTWIVDSYDRIDLYPIAHNNVSSIWCN